jgi:aryl-alcohol dehydrogenase-like predicted oxidoreductase
MLRSKSSVFSRREVMQAGVCAGISAALPGSLLVAAAADSGPLPVITKVIPASGEKIPVMGIGTNQFHSAEYDELRAVLRRMAELGGSVIDTAGMYDEGQSETVIGTALAELRLRKKMFLATKFNAAGASYHPPPGAPPLDTVTGRESFERSLQRLHTDQIDLLMAHLLSSVEPLMPIMQELKKTGRVRYLGITSVQPADHPQLMEYMRTFPIDFVQVDYSLGDRAAAAAVFPLAQERGIAVMAAVPLGGGRASLLNQVQGRDLPKWAADFDASSWSQFFLKYVVSHPAVTCAIPGSSKVQHLEDNQAAGHGRLPDAKTRKKMEDFWDGTR